MDKVSEILEEIEEAEMILKPYCEAGDLNRLHESSAEIVAGTLSKIQSLLTSHAILSPDFSIREMKEEMSRLSVTQKEENV